MVRQILNTLEEALKYRPHRGEGRRFPVANHPVVREIEVNEGQHIVHKAGGVEFIDEPIHLDTHNAVTTSNFALNINLEKALEKLSEGGFSFGTPVSPEHWYTQHPIHHGGTRVGCLVVYKNKDVKLHLSREHAREVIFKLFGGKNRLFAGRSEYDPQTTK